MIRSQAHKASVPSQFVIPNGFFENFDEVAYDKARDAKQAKAQEAFRIAAEAYYAEIDSKS